MAVLKPCFVAASSKDPWAVAKDRKGAAGLACLYRGERDCSAQARQNAVMWTLPAMFDVICWHRFATAFEVWHLVARGRMWTLVGCSIKFSCSRLLTATYTCCPSASCAA